MFFLAGPGRSTTLFAIFVAGVSASCEEGACPASALGEDVTGLDSEADSLRVSLLQRRVHDLVNGSVEAAGNCGPPSKECDMAIKYIRNTDLKEHPEKYRGYVCCTPESSATDVQGFLAYLGKAGCQMPCYDPVPTPAPTPAAPTPAPGDCSASDQAKINSRGKGTGPGSLFDDVIGCARRNYSPFYGFSKKKSKQCVVDHIGTGDACADCLVAAQSYLIRHCKYKCMNDQCSDACQTCVKPLVPMTEKCTGMELEKLEGDSVCPPKALEAPP